MVHPPPKKTGSDDPLNKTAIRKRLHFTDERHDLVTAIRKYGVFADGPTLSFRDTGFLAEKGVSLQEKKLNQRKHVRDTGFWARNGVSLQGKTSVSQNRLAIQTFGRKRVCRGMENSSMCENPFTTGQLGRMRVG